MAKSGKAPYFFALIVLLAVLAVYLPGLRNELVFDDLRLTDGSIFGTYGNLLDIKQRMVSYGSFVWIEQLVGSGWWKQRIVNIALHLGVVAALYALLQALMASTRFPQDIEDQPHFATSQRAALRVAVTLFALHPLAVYAVGYLIQRSILMATLFALLACWAFVRGLQTRSPAWFAGALLSYLLAVLSKEHAVMTVGLAIPLYIHVSRPGWRKIGILAACTLAVLCIAVTSMLHFYGDVIGQLFDAQSQAFAQQLEALKPGITHQIYPLSILNQAALFFFYGLLWIVPYVGWMSIDIRPAFPMGLFSSWHVVGALGYVVMLVGAIWLLVRRSGVLSLVAMLLLLPLLWFVTEFSTVWVQDPFVLYRSYLWGIALPGLLAIALTGFQPRVIYIFGIVVGTLLGALAIERNLSLSEEVVTWTDAAEKTNLQAPANAVGRSRPFLNLGAYYIRKGLIDQAERNIATAVALNDRGELGSGARFNSGVILQLKKNHVEALRSFDAAEALGYSQPGLYFHKAESLAALGQMEPALESFRVALTQAEADPLQRGVVPTIRIRLVETAMAAQRYDEAITGFKTLLQTNPNDPRLRLGLGMAMVGKGDNETAIQVFDQLLSSHPGAPVYYGRAIAKYRMGQQKASLSDLDRAIQLDPKNPQYTQMRAVISAGKK